MATDRRRCHETVALPPALDLNELQALGPAELEELCRDFDVRMHPGRTRHHHILDLVRAALSRNIPVTVEGFFDQVADSFGVLRWPRLNFLPVPEDVGVPRAIVQRFHFRLGQKVKGTLRLPRDREKLLMLDEVTADRRAAGRGMAGADPVRQPDAALSGRPDHAREFEDEFDQRARGRSAHAARARAART